MLAVDYAFVVNNDGAMGADTAFGRIAPLPSEDTAELPIKFVAVTRAVTLVESTRLKGEDLRAATGIVQLRDDKIEELVSASQFVRSFSKVNVDVFISNL